MARNRIIIFFLFLTAPTIFIVFVTKLGLGIQRFGIQPISKNKALLYIQI